MLSNYFQTNLNSLEEILWLGYFYLNSEIKLFLPENLELELNQMSIIDITLYSCKLSWKFFFFSFKIKKKENPKLQNICWEKCTLIYPFFNWEDTYCAAKM